MQKIMASVQPTIDARAGRTPAMQSSELSSGASKPSFQKVLPAETVSSVDSARVNQPRSVKLGSLGPTQSGRQSGLNPNLAPQSHSGQPAPVAPLTWGFSAPPRPGQRVANAPSGESASKTNSTTTLTSTQLPAKAPKYERIGTLPPSSGYE